MEMPRRLRQLDLGVVRTLRELADPDDPIGAGSCRELLIELAVFDWFAIDESRTRIVDADLERFHTLVPTYIMKELAGYGAAALRSEGIRLRGWRRIHLDDLLDRHELRRGDYQRAPTIDEAIAAFLTHLRQVEGLAGFFSPWSTRGEFALAVCEKHAQTRLELMSSTERWIVAE